MGNGLARECVRALGAEEIGKEPRVKSIIKQLDKIFIKTEIHELILLSRSFIITDKCQVQMLQILWLNLINFITNLHSLI